MLTRCDINRIFRTQTLYLGIRYTHAQAWDEWNRLLDRLLCERRITRYMWAHAETPFPRCNYVSVTWKRRIVTA